MRCPYCTLEIDYFASRCPHCCGEIKSDYAGTQMVGLIILFVILAICGVVTSTVAWISYYVFAFSSWTTFILSVVVGVTSILFSIWPKPVPTTKQNSKRPIILSKKIIGVLFVAVVIFVYKGSYSDYKQAKESAAIPSVPISAPSIEKSAEAEPLQTVVVQRFMSNGTVVAGKRQGSDISIPVTGSTVGQVIELASGTRGWLGVDAQQITEDHISIMELGSAPRGMFIKDVIKGAPADLAGIVAGDLLVSINNKSVDTKEAIQDVLTNIPVGSVVPIKIIRDGSEKYLILKIGQMPRY